jgi:energy-coupling factor transporter ATP-binding protein EcfA2
MPANNPFTPIFGKVPAHMAGRRQLIDEITNMLENPTNNPSIVSLFMGSRGSGKTTLLSYFAGVARANGWVDVRVTAIDGMLDEIIAQAHRAAAHLLEPASTKKIKSIGVANIGTIEWENSAGKEDAARKTTWRTEMADLFDELDRTETGLLICVDEVDPSLVDMTVLVTAVQHFIDEGRKVSLLMAGLPYSLSTMLVGKSTSFLRRAAKHDLSKLADYEVEAAFCATLAGVDVEIKESALSDAVQAVEGFPYMLQLVGYYAYELGASKSLIDNKAVSKAIDLASQELANRVYDATFFELSGADKDFLFAMLNDQKMTRQAELAERLGKPSAHVSKYKKRLLQAGVIEEQSKGCIAFCLPGFRNYLAGQK